MPIEIIGADLGYGKAAVLRDVNVSFLEGEITAIQGGNGVGKSTLLRALCGLAVIQRGTIRVDGALFPVGRQADFYARELGVCYIGPENRVVPSLTLEENLRLAGWRLSAKSRCSKIVECFEDAVFASLSKKRHTPAFALSGGEKVLVSLMMARIGESKYLLLDEPLVGVDRERKAMVLDAIRGLMNPGRGIAMVEHSVSSQVFAAGSVVEVKTSADGFGAVSVRMPI